jgi:hypothetical protein
MSNGHCFGAVRLHIIPSSRLRGGCCDINNHSSATSSVDQRGPLRDPTVPTTSKPDGTTSSIAPTTSPDTVSGITASCPQPYAAAATPTGASPADGLHVTWQVYTTDAGKSYTVALYQYRTYQDANHVISTLTADSTEADFTGLLADGWLYRVEITVPGVNDGSALREACVDLNNAKPASVP